MTEKKPDASDAGGSAKEESSAGQVRPFADLLRALNRGKTHDEMSVQMQDLVAAVKETKKKGSITLTLIVNPTKSEVLEVVEEIRVKAPSHTRAASIFYVDDDHNLVRDNPHQDPIPGIRVVPDDDSGKPLREVQ